MSKKITIMIGSKDRPTEVALLLQSLRTQTVQDFDVFIVDDASGTPLESFYFIMAMCSRLRVEGHNVKLIRNNMSHGISAMRNQCVKFALEHYPNTELLLRIDDDTIAEPDFLQKLVDVIDAGYDLASGVTPVLVGPEWVRETTYVKPCINRVVLDETGGFIINGDDCGFKYYDTEIIPTHHFRSTALYKKEIHTVHNIWYEENLTTSGMREEEFFSFRCILAGLKLGVNTGAIHYHLQTPSGGHRTCTQDKHLQNQKILNRWVKKKVAEHGNFIESYNKRMNIGEENKFSNMQKSANFIMTKEE
jgi:glycosyltransferase involved in cell wall biosynthesis